jgi:hypothetical protein
MAIINPNMAIGPLPQHHPGDPPRQTPGGGSRGSTTGVCDF